MNIAIKSIEGPFIHGWKIGKKRKTIIPYGQKTLAGGDLDFKDIKDYIIYIPDTIGKTNRDIIEYIANCYASFISKQRSKNYTFDDIIRNEKIGIEKFLNYFDEVTKYDKEYILLIGKIL